MSVQAIVEYIQPLDHILSDSEKIEIVNGQVRLKSQVLASEVLFSNFDTANELTSKRGDKELVFEGTDNTGQVADGVLKFPNQDRSTASYKAIQNITGDFAFRAKLIFNIATTALTRNLVRLVSNVDSSQIRFYLSNQGGGVSRIYREIYDSSGTLISSFITGTRTLSVGSSINIAFSNDDDGNTLTYLDGVLVSTVASPTFDFTNCELLFGDNTSASQSVCCNYDNVQLFNSHAITAAFAFPFPEPTTYSLVEQTVLHNTPFTMSDWSSYDSIYEALTGSQLKQFIHRDTIPYKYNTTTSVWEPIDLTSTFISQCNTKEEIESNRDDFPLTSGIGTQMQFGSVLKSDDGYTTPILDNYSLNYGKTVKPDAPSTCLVKGTFFNVLGKSVTDVEIEISSKDHMAGPIFVGPSAKEPVNADGSFAIQIIETETINKTIDWTFHYKENGEAKTFVIKRLTIRNLAERTFEQVLSDSGKSL